MTGLHRAVGSGRRWTVQYMKCGPSTGFWTATQDKGGKMPPKSHLSLGVPVLAGGSIYPVTQGHETLVRPPCVSSVSEEVSSSRLPCRLTLFSLFSHCSWSRIRFWRFLLPHSMNSSYSTDGSDSFYHHTTPPPLPRTRCKFSEGKIYLIWASQVVLMVQSLHANAGDITDMGSTPGSGRSPGGGHGNPPQYCCPENPMDRGAWKAMIHRVSKSQTWLKQLNTYISYLSLYPQPRAWALAIAEVSRLF